MNRLTEDIVHLFNEETYESTRGWLRELKDLYKENYIIFSSSGAVKSGIYIKGEYAFQKPCVKVLKGEVYAIYDVRYNIFGNIYKVYSEFMHEIFHCYQIRRNFDINDIKMAEGGALFLEMLLYEKYTCQTVDKQIEVYRHDMTDSKYSLYYMGAMEIYEKFLKGFTWENYFRGDW